MHLKCVVLAISHHSHLSFLLIGSLLYVLIQKLIMLSGMCLLTYLFFPKLSPKRPKTNDKCQRYFVFVFVIVQGRISLKKHQNQPKSLKRARGLEKRQRAEAEEANYPRKAQNDLYNP